MTNLFRNSSSGALTREQAVALEKKRAAERRRNQRQAGELAAQGRGNDTEVAHVALGEIVLPKMLQTQNVLSAIRQAAQDAGIPLGRLRIGSPSNSINPETGIPEFDETQIDELPIEEVVVSGSLITDDPSTDKVIEGLHPSIRYDAAKFINDVKDQTGQQLRIPSRDGGYRTDEYQDGLYAQGRTQPGKIVTNAPGGESLHNYGLAFDVLGLDGKKINWDMNYDPVAPYGKQRGFEWGGDWSKPDRPHFQRTYGYTPDQLKQMVGPGSAYPTIPGQRNRWR